MDARLKTLYESILESDKVAAPVTAGFAQQIDADGSAPDASQEASMVKFFV
jgi:hypothetical protein